MMVFFGNTFQTIADKYIIFGFFLLALAGFEHAYVYAVQRNDGRPFESASQAEADDEARSIDETFMLGYLGVWVLFHFVLMADVWQRKQETRTEQNFLKTTTKTLAPVSSPVITSDLNHQQQVI